MPPPPSPAPPPSSPDSPPLPPPPPPPPPRLGDKELHVAPMLDVSTVEFRHFLRILTSRAVLWTEMVAAETLAHCVDVDPHLSMGPSPVFGGGDDDNSDNSDDANAKPDGDDVHIDPHPVICQIGSNDPTEAAHAVRLVRRYGYDGVDLNAECPSDRVAGAREFGAALMRDPGGAACVVRAMVEAAAGGDGAGDCSREGDDGGGGGGGGDCDGGGDGAGASGIPVSVKTRIGVDEYDTFEYISNFIGALVDAGCSRFVVHARMVHTRGLSPSENRSVPPLDYSRVYRLCRSFPRCRFWLNGGLRSLVDARAAAYGAGVRFDEDGNGHVHVGPPADDGETIEEEEHDGAPCDLCSAPRGSCVAPPPLLSPPNLRGVMLGRLALDRPMDLADVDRYFYGEGRNPCRNRREAMETYAGWLEGVYPRRCCDDDDRVTAGMVRDRVAPIRRAGDFCPVCEGVYGRPNGAGRRDGDGDGDGVDDSSAESLGTDGEEGETDPSDGGGGYAPRRQSARRRRRHERKCPGAKILSRVVDRSLRPAYGVLSGLRGSSAFRRELHRLGRDMTVRNCGPGYMLRRAMGCVGDEVWDMELEFDGGEVGMR